MSRKVTQLKAHAGGSNPHHLDSRAEKSYSTRARWALRAIRKYVLLGLAPSGTYEILHARARAIFCSARESPVICIYTVYILIVRFNVYTIYVYYILYLLVLQ